MWNHFLYINFIVFSSSVCMDLLSRLNNYSYIIWKGLLFCNIFLCPVVLSIVCKIHQFLIFPFLLAPCVQFCPKQLEYTLWLPCIKLSFEACVNVCLYALIPDLVNFQLRDYVCQHCISFAFWHLIDQIGMHPSVLPCSFIYTHHSNWFSVSSAVWISLQ